MIFEFKVTEMSGKLVDKAIFDIQIPVSLPELFSGLLPILDVQKPEMALAIKEIESFDIRNTNNFLGDDSPWKEEQFSKKHWLLGVFGSKYKIEVAPHQA